MRVRIPTTVYKHLWVVWHSDLRGFFDRISDRRYGAYVDESRPRWHMCCNGNKGGWRTALCDWLETKWRYP